MITALLRSNGYGFGGYCSLELDESEWKAFGAPMPQYRAIGGRDRNGLPRRELQRLELRLRLGEHEGTRTVVKIVTAWQTVALVIPAIDAPTFSKIEIVAATLVDPVPIPTVSEQLLRGMHHD